MAHGIKFGNYHTWDDLGLSMTDKAPNVGTAEVYQNFIDIPGGMFIDASEYPGGFPAYRKRMQSFEFIKKESGMSWPQTVSNVMNKLHGRSMDIILDEDPAWHYHGRLIVQAPEVANDTTKLVVNAVSKPYKEYNRSLADVWQWDETDFSTDTSLIDGGLSNIAVSTSSYYRTIPYSPFNPTLTLTMSVTGFTSSNNEGRIEIYIGGRRVTMYEIDATGDYTVSKNIPMSNDNPTISAGTVGLIGTLTIDYTPRSM